eukprot:CAMPEP_0118894634 /NCGR_PEP_ID=MMETSP1166-20130328/3332_1 /TAXON_ID=1104430 /ORGANISM="Chrysoreinhardia sp, Strain CCMP3193" /LENGTH=225 /DNA_ID=CAMNT_0006833573 /DNA_START=20 /DNA_END=694 /DNA_ORIENTATION=+
MDADAEQRSLREQLEEANRRVERLARERDAAARERDAAERERDAAERETEQLKKQRVDDDTAPRPFYKRLDGKCYSEIVAIPDADESATPARADPIVPKSVVWWYLDIPGRVEDLPEFAKCLATKTNEPMLRNFQRRAFNRKWTEANMEHQFLSRLVNDLWDNLKGLLPEDKVRGVAPLFQQRNAVGTIPDWLFSQSSDGFYDGGENEMDDATIVVGESKSPAKY